MTMTSTSADTSRHRALIEQELRQRVAAARATEVAAPQGPLALRCRACGETNGYRAGRCRGCGTAFNAELVWLSTLEGSPSGEAR